MDRTSKNQVKKAGEILRRGNNDPGFSNAFEIMQEWRALHTVPLNSITMAIRTIGKKHEKGALVAQRLKRAPTIIEKLRHNPEMSLARMHDIAGARIVLSDCISVHAFIQKLDSGRIRHEAHRDYDYITRPKPDGYRSFHRVFKFVGSRSTLRHDGLLVEVQVRSRIQHAWATTVEIMSYLLRQGLKRNQGDDKWLSFFRYAGSALACLEGEPEDPNLQLSGPELFEYVHEEAKRLMIRQKLRGFQKALELTSSDSPHNIHLLHLRESNFNDTLTLEIRSYTKKDANRAQQDYLELERNATSKDDVVLVSAETTRNLMRAYPNYFLDSSEFIQILDRISARARRQIQGRAAQEVRQQPLPGLTVDLDDLAARLPPLGPHDSVRGYKALARILWALELANRGGLGPISASRIASLLAKHSNMPMLRNNVARFFRTHQEDQGIARHWTRKLSGNSIQYTISPEGRRALLSIDREKERAQLRAHN